SFDPILKTPEDTDDEGNGEEDLVLNVGREEGHDEEEDELYRDVNINQGRGMESIFETTSQMDAQNPTSVAPLPIAEIRKLTDVNINKLYQPWRSFAAIINKCLTGKSSGYDSLRLSQAQILNSNAYKEYYAVATGAAPPKPNASVRKTKSSSDTT
nr:hypothetical protein [Tanacetum cinerariifolium]